VKVRNLDHPTLLICTTSNRIKLLIKALNLNNEIFKKELQKGMHRDVPSHNLDLSQKAFFALTTEFCSVYGGGIFGTNWRKIDDSIASFYVKDGDIRVSKKNL
jgi:hypothetical protein